MMKKIFLYSIMSLILLLSGCSFVEKLGITRNIGPIEGRVGTAHQDQTEQPPPTSEASIDNQLSAKKIERLILPSYESQPEKPLPELEAIDPTELVLEKNPVMINVEGMPLSDFITHAIGNTLKTTYFIDEAVKNIKAPVTLRMSKKMPAETAFEIVIDILRQYDLIIEQRGGSLYILKSKPKQEGPLNMRVGRSVPDTRSQIVRLVPLAHINILNIKQMISSFKTDVKTKAYVNENAFLFTGPATSIKEIVSFIEMLDVPYLQEKILFIIPLTYWHPDDFIKQIKTILESIGFVVAKRSGGPGISFIPIRSLNSVLVIAPDDKSMKVVMEWKKNLDTPESAGSEEKAFTYKPLYSRASDLAAAIKTLYGVTVPQTTNNKTAKTQKAPSIIKGLKIEGDDSRNLVVIITVPTTYKKILYLLKELDTPPRQVLLEATVAELTLKDDLQYGLEFFLKNSHDKGPFNFSTIGGVGLVPGGLSFNFTSDSGKFGTLINAFTKDNRIKVLSRPRLMVLDNESATINIGTDVPVITGEATTTDIVSAPGTASSILRNIQYISTGITLSVTPTINTEDILTLDISIDLDEAQTNAFSNIDSPMILTRRIKTKIVVSSGQSVILGGLMRENNNSTINKIPILGDIPILGYLFKTTSKSTDTTELIIIITPTILTTTDDATRLTEELKKELKWLK